MASVSQLGVPTLGTGILQPHFAYRFRARFFEGTTEYPELSMQLMSIGSFARNDSILSFQFQDDVTSKAAFRLLDLRARDPHDLTVQVELYDGNDQVTRQHLFGGVHVYDPRFSALCYDGGELNERFTFVVPDRAEGMRANPIVDALKGSRLEFVKRNYAAGVNTIEVDFKFASMTTHFPSIPN